MVKSADGKRHGSKFRMNRYNDAQGDGERAQAHEQEAAPSEEQEERIEEEVAPGIHDEVKRVAAEHGPAHEVHIAHNHEMGQHHVTSMHPDGYQHDADHASAEDAHEHGKHAAGVVEGAGDEPEPEDNYEEEEAE